MLGALDYAAVCSEEVGTLQGFETKVVVIKVTVVDNFRVEALSVFNDDFVDIFGNERGWLAVLGVDVCIHDLDTAIRERGREGRG
jgi:hypothetical protein